MPNLSLLFLKLNKKVYFLWNNQHIAYCCVASNEMLNFDKEPGEILVLEFQIMLVVNDTHSHFHIEGVFEKVPDKCL